MVCALWAVACYAAGLGDETAEQWLAHAERIPAATGVELWPGEALRDETLAVLGMDDPPAPADSAAPLDHGAALAEAAAWLGTRAPEASSPRPDALRFAIASG